MTKEKDDVDDNERAAAREFRAEVKPPTRKPEDRAAARKAAQDASEAAKAYLAQVDPASALPGRVDAALGDSSDDLPEADYTQAAKPLEQCACGCELGGRVRGVCHNDTWYCPTCFMRVRNMHAHAVARPVKCPTCNHMAVDFSGRNVCPVCHSTAARPMAPQVFRHTL